MEECLTRLSFIFEMIFVAIFRVVQYMFTSYCWGVGVVTFGIVACWGLDLANNRGMGIFLYGLFVCLCSVS